jgi:uncharacterized membrane protein
VVAIAAGVLPLGTALFADDARFHAPRWLVAMIGSMFVLAGVMLVRLGAPAAQRRAADVVGALLGAQVATGFFSGGPSAWGMSGTLPVALLPTWATTGLFYLLQGVVALICILVFAFAWRQLYRAVATTRSGSSAGRLE